MCFYIINYYISMHYHTKKIQIYKRYHKSLKTILIEAFHLYILCINQALHQYIQDNFFKDNLYIFLLNH